MHVRYAQLALAFIAFAHRLPAQDNSLDAAAALDGQHKCAEAEAIYNQLLNAGRPSTALLNNLGYHYLTCGQPEKAKETFERILKISPAHHNANLELARFAVQQKNPAAALAYLSQIGNDDPEAALVRIEALNGVRKHPAAKSLAAAILQAAGNNPRVLFALGITCGRSGLYPEAVDAFGRVLAQYPDDFDVLYNLGLAATHLPDYKRAKHAFEVALNARPQDVDTLFQLGRVESALENYTRAVYLLAQAQKLSPARPDIALALARAAQSAGYYGDAILAYGDYLKLVTDDDIVRRDRALLLGFTPEGQKEGLSELENYIQKHPSDAIAFYDLAQVRDRTDHNQALLDAATAVRLDPKFEKARYYRALLLEKSGRFEESIGELNAATSLDERDVHAYDLLALDYLNTDNPAKAEQVLRKALAMAPKDRDVLFHLATALINQGRATEARPLLTEFQELKDAPKTVPRVESGVIEAANLSSEELSARLMQRLSTQAQANPADITVKLALGRALLAAGQNQGALKVFGELLASNPDTPTLEEAGRTLLQAQQYPLARDFLQRAAAQSAPTLDLAIAVSLIDGPQAAMKILDSIPQSQDSGDGRLLRAKILDEIGQPAAADRVLSESIQLPITNPQLAAESVYLLLRHGKSLDALKLIDHALQSTPDDQDLLLAKVGALQASGKEQEALRVLKDVERRWPEWDRPYLLDALLLAGKNHVADAREKIQIARALGAENHISTCIQEYVTAPSRQTAECSCVPGVFAVFFPCLDGK
jgi:tetratricopeptide (TPR) repeat protein